MPVEDAEDKRACDCTRPENISLRIHVSEAAYRRLFIMNGIGDSLQCADDLAQAFAVRHRDVDGAYHIVPGKTLVGLSVDGHGGIQDAFECQLVVIGFSGGIVFLRA